MVWSLEKLLDGFDNFSGRRVKFVNEVEAVFPVINVVAILEV